MLKKREHHRILALLFAALYLFVALFSQNFHNHGSGEIYKDYHFKKAEKTFAFSALEPIEINYEKNYLGSNILMGIIHSSKEIPPC